LSALLIGSSVLNVVAQNQQAAREDPLRRTSVYRLPEMDRAIVQQDITYKTINGAALKLDAYYPPGTKDGARLPVVIFVMCP
jgi:enterochelin esterase-like enzyme